MLNEIYSVYIKAKAHEFSKNKKGAIQLGTLLGEIVLAGVLLPLIYSIIQATNTTGWDKIVVTLWKDYFFLLLVVGVVIGFVIQVMPRRGPKM